MNNFINKNLHKIVIMIPLVLSLLMLLMAYLHNKTMLVKMYDTNDAGVVEVRLPSVELEKYKKLDKIGE